MADGYEEELQGIRDTLQKHDRALFGFFDPASGMYVKGVLQNAEDGVKKLASIELLLQRIAKYGGIGCGTLILLGLASATHNFGLIELIGRLVKGLTQ